MAFTSQTRYGAMETYSDNRHIVAVVESLIRELERESPILD